MYAILDYDAQTNIKFYEMEIKNMREWTKKDLFNAKNNSIKAEDLTGEILRLVSAGTYSDVVKREDGEQMETLYGVVAMREDNSTVYTASPSPTFVQAMSDMVDYATDIAPEDVFFTIVKKKSNNGRQFLSLELL